ncbi:MAG: hypothetical protein Q9217_001781 [Psora testacea]
MRKAAYDGDVVTLSCAYKSAHYTWLKSPSQTVFEPTNFRALEVEALCCAIRSNQYTVSDYLMGLGVDVQGTYPRSEPEEYRWLYDFSGPSARMCEWYGSSAWCTPLYICSEWSHGTALMRLLLEKGALVNSPSTFGGQTALHGVMVSRDFEQTSMQDVACKTLLLLEWGADPNIRSRSGESIIHAAAEKDYSEALSMLIRFGANIHAVCDGYSPLMTASENRSRRATEVLLKSGAQMDGNPSQTKRTPSQVAFLGHHECLTSGSSVLQLLLDYGAPVADVKHWQIAKLLLELESEALGLKESAELSEPFRKSYSWHQYNARESFSRSKAKADPDYQTCIRSLETALRQFRDYKLGIAIECPPEMATVELKMFPTAKKEVLYGMRHYRACFVDDGLLCCNYDLTDH